MCFLVKTVTQLEAQILFLFPLAVVNMLQLIRLYIGAKIYPEFAKVVKNRHWKAECKPFLDLFAQTERKLLLLKEQAYLYT